MVYFVKKKNKKNDKLCQKSLNLFRPAGENAVAMATLKDFNKISTRDEWTAPESFDII